MSLDAPPPPLAPGDRVILAGADPSGWSAGLPGGPWTVVECACPSCAAGSQVAIDVPRSPAMIEMYPEAGPWRHVGARGLRRPGELSRRQAEAWADSLAMGCGVGQASAHAEEAGHSATVLTQEWAALALADSLGGIDLTEGQAYMLERWRAQRGGRPL